jgi:hypothetical protein
MGPAMHAFRPSIAMDAFLFAVTVLFYIGHVELDRIFQASN